MIDMEKIKSYLQAAATNQGINSARRAPRPQPFVTISRQAGASGRSLAEAMLAAMRKDGRPFLQGWHMFDDELCEVVAADPKLAVLADSLIDERFRGSFEDYLAHSVAGLSPQAAVFKKIFKTIRGLAVGGKAIIVGRAGCCVTRDLDAGIHIRLVAPEGVRRSVIMKRYGLEERPAEIKMGTLDESRRRLMKNYFSKDIDDPLLYHAIFNMGEMPLDTAAKLAVEMVAEKMERPAAALQIR